MKKLGPVEALAFPCFGLLALFFLIPVGIKDPAYSVVSPSQFPRIVAGIFFVCAVLSVIQDIKFRSLPIIEKTRLEFFAIPAISIGFVFIIPLFGFAISVFLCLLLLFLIFRERRGQILLLLVVFGTAGIYFVFIGLLRVPFPVGPFKLL